MIKPYDKAHILLAEYERAIVETDRLDKSDITPILLGLFGEVGSVMSTSKKRRREKTAFSNGYKRDLEEELGDTLWYFAVFCRRLDMSLSDLFAEALDSGNYSISIAANADPDHPVAKVFSVNDLALLDSVLLRLGESSARLLGLRMTAEKARPLLIDFIGIYLEAVQASSASFAGVVKGNMTKARGRFLMPAAEDLPDFDAEFPVDEQLPREFEIDILQRSNGRSYLRWNGVFIGDPLTDNIADSDGYRFHDVFHFANAAILHWSPTFRALIKHKRKSKPEVDEAQDSGRAIVVDEGVAAFVFSYAKSLDFFEGHDGVSFGLLKAVQNFVRGYEVDQCPLNLWEQAILQGYKVFRQVKQNGGGVVVGNRAERTIKYKPQKDKA